MASFAMKRKKGANAWSLATTGGVIDFIPASVSGSPLVFEWHRLPWMVDVVRSRTSAIYQYASVPFVGLGGLSVATARMAAAAAGTLAVAAVGLVAIAVWGGAAGLAVAGWLALCPWHLVFSRWALEGIFVPLFLAMTLGGLAGLRRGRRWGAPLVGSGLGWMFYAYTGAQPFVLAWGVCLAALYWRAWEWRRWHFWVGVGLFCLPVVPTLAALLARGGTVRLGHVALWNDPSLGPGQMALRFIQTYFSHFDPRFLFFSGDPNPRHCVPGMGQLLWIDLALVPIGLAASFRRRMELRWVLLAACLCGAVAIGHHARRRPPCAAFDRDGRADGLLGRAWAGGLGAVALGGVASPGRHAGP